MDSANMGEYSENSINEPSVLNKKFKTKSDKWNIERISKIGQNITQLTFLACFSVVSVIQIYKQIYKPGNIYMRSKFL